jgi:hypothetical protein
MRVGGGVRVEIDFGTGRAATRCLSGRIGGTVTLSSDPAMKPTSAPLSPYEGDPAVQALRAWASQVGKTVNAGEVINPALNKLMTASMAKDMKFVMGDEVGGH